MLLSVQPPGSGPCVAYDNGTDPARAAALAASVDVAVVFVATSSSEGGDRGSLSFDSNADALVAAVAAAASKKVVVAGVTPGAVLTPWRADVSALVLGFMPGQEYGHALCDVLFGETNPSAKLPLTMPVGENDLHLTTQMWPGEPVKPGQPPCGKGGAHDDRDCVTSVYSEELLVGYRYYDHHNVAPAFPFGFGLSYTTFALSNLKVAPAASSSAAAADALYTVTVDVANTGKLAGAETPQLYLGFPPEAGEPPKQLKGFAKVSLKPGGKKTVAFALDAKALSVWDATAHKWAEAKGSFAVTVGASSRDPKALTATLQH